MRNKLLTIMAVTAVMSCLNEPSYGKKNISCIAGLSKISRNDASAALLLAPQCFGMCGIEADQTCPSGWRYYW